MGEGGGEEEAHSGGEALCGRNGAGEGVRCEGVKCEGVSENVRM